MIDFTNDINTYFDLVNDVIRKIDRNEINQFLNLMTEALDKEKNVYIMGNGGSAATASHIVCDFNKGISMGLPKRFRFICLNDNIPSLMAYANDMSYDDIFIEQLRGFLQPGEYVIGISGSGNSANVVRALQYANDNGGITIGLTGYDGGLVKKTAKFGVHVPVNNMQVVEDLHMIIDHMSYQVLKKYLASNL